jgi:MinD-like ATPase involved in chromosome partitioning or flagellar assembly
VAAEVARKLQVPQMLLVVNKALASMNFAALRQQVENSYNAPVAALFAETEEMIELGSAGLFCLRYPHHPFTKELERLAEQVAG